MKGKEFPVLLIVVALVLAGSLLKWIFGSGPNVPDPMMVSSDGKARVTKEEFNDRSSYTKLVSKFTEEIYKLWITDWLIKDKAKDIERAKAEAQTEADKRMRKDVDRRLGGNFEQEVLAEAQRIENELESRRALQERTDDLRVREESLSAEAQERAFKNAVLRRAEDRFNAALQALRKESAGLLGVARVSEAQQARLDALKAEVVGVLKELIVALDQPTFKDLKVRLGNRQGFDRRAWQAEVEKRQEAFVGRCRDLQPVCLMTLRQESGAWMEELAGYAREAYGTLRFADALGFVGEMAAHAAARPEQGPRPPGADAAHRVTTFCAEIGKRGYLAVDGGDFPHRDLGPVRRLNRSDMHAPADRHCVWAWRVGGLNGWSLQCSNWPFGFDYPTGDITQDTQAAPNGELRGKRMNPLAPAALEASVTEDCRVAIEELKVSKGLPERSRSSLPGLQGVVNRPR